MVQKYDVRHGGRSGRAVALFVASPHSQSLVYGLSTAIANATSRPRSFLERSDPVKRDQWVMMISGLYSVQNMIIDQ